MSAVCLKAHLAKIVVESGQAAVARTTEQSEIFVSNDPSSKGEVQNRPHEEGRSRSYEPRAVDDGKYDFVNRWSAAVAQ